jgi:hypothetical protein
MRKLITYFALMALPLLFSRCSISQDLTKISDAVDSLNIVVGTPDFRNIIHFDLTDTKTNSPITGDVKLKISGTGAASVYSNIGEQETEYTATNGMLDLVLDPHIDSAYLEENPIRFEVTPILSGYLGQTQQVEISHERLKYVPLSLINLSDGNTDGVKVSVENLSASYDASHKTTAPVTHLIDGSSTTMEIQQGTLLKDASDNPLTGNVKSQVVFYSAGDSATQEMIQGSLIGEAQLEDSSTIQTQLISAGMFSAQLTVGGSTVKKLEGEGLKLKTRIPDDLFNPDKERTVAEGDTIPMWSKEEGSGKWVLEKYSLVKKDIEGFYLEDVVNHLSTWNWDWYCASRYTSSRYCSSGPRFYWKLSGFTGATVSATVSLNSAYSPFGTMNDNIYSGSYTQLSRTPSNVSGKITFVERYPIAGRKLVFNPASISFTNLCTLGNKTITVTAVYDDILSVNLNLSARSSDPTSKIIISPTTYLYYKPVGQSYWNNMYMRNGIATIKLKIGQDYDIFGQFGKNSGYGKLRIEKVGTDKLQVIMTPSINMNGGSTDSAITLPAISKPANNVIDIVYVAILSPDVFDKLK